MEEKYTAIEKYLADEMQGKELDNFEKKLSADSDLQEELNLHRQVAETLKGEKIHDLRNVLQVVDKDWKVETKENTTKIIPFNFRRLLTIAAAIALLIVGYQLFTNNNLSSEELYTTNFETYPMLLNQRSADENGSDLEIYNNAITFYAKGQNTEALAAFEKLIQTQPENITYQFYQSNLLLAEKKSTTAIPIFQKILDGNYPLFEEQARWYLALGFLQNDETENAKALLEKIQARQFKFKEASEILEQL